MVKPVTAASAASAASTEVKSLASPRLFQIRTPPETDVIADAAVLVGTVLSFIGFWMKGRLYPLLGLLCLCVALVNSRHGAWSQLTSLFSLTLMSFFLVYMDPRATPY